MPSTLPIAEHHFRRVAGPVLENGRPEECEASLARQGLRADTSNLRHDTIVVPEAGVCAAAYAAGMVGARRQTCIDRIILVSSCRRVPGSRLIHQMRDSSETVGVTHSTSGASGS
jgi:hypothetical protein